MEAQLSAIRWRDLETPLAEGARMGCPWRWVDRLAAPGLVGFERSQSVEEAPVAGRFGQSSEIAIHFQQRLAIGLFLN